MEQGNQTEDIDKKIQMSTLLDRPLYQESPGTLPVHLQHHLPVMVHYTDPFAVLWVESGSLQNSRQKPTVQDIKGLGLIQIDQCSFSAVFYSL